MNQLPAANHAGRSAPGCPVEQSSTVSGLYGTAASLQTRGRPALKRVVARLRSFTLIVNAALREIFDETAYARFLKQSKVSSSRAAYAAFRREHEVSKARRPRCC